jgi:hypothetical protein
MGKKINLAYIFMMASLLFFSCDKVTIGECQEKETILLALPDTTWLLSTKTNKTIRNLESSLGLIQTLTTQKTGKEKTYIEPIISLPADACREYYVLPISASSKASLYPFELTYGVSHNPFDGNYSLTIFFNSATYALERFTEKIVVNLRDSLAEYKSEFEEKNNKQNIITKNGFCVKFSNFTNQSGISFNNVFLIPFQAPSVFNNKAVLKQVWISKVEGLVQYEFTDGTIWSVN